MKLESGRYYYTRTNKVKQIACVDRLCDNGTTEAMDYDGLTYESNGRRCIGICAAGALKDNDLVTPVFEADQQWQDAQTNKVYKLVRWDANLGGWYYDGQAYGETVLSERWLMKYCKQLPGGKLSEEECKQALRQVSTTWWPAIAKIEEQLSSDDAVQAFILTVVGTSGSIRTSAKGSMIELFGILELTRLKATPKLKDNEI